MLTFFWDTAILLVNKVYNILLSKKIKKFCLEVIWPILNYRKFCNLKTSIASQLYGLGANVLIINNNNNVYY